MKTPRTTPDAETVALKALAWLAARDDLVERFAASTGASLEDMRSAAQDPAFLAAVLEFVALEDAWVVAFCDAEGLPYDAPLRALAALPGGRREEWP